MQKGTKMWIILNSIFPVVFSTLFFLLGGINHNASVWISYVFIHLAYFALLLTPKMIRGGKSAAVFGFSLYAQSAGCFFLEFIIGLTFILVAPEGFKAALAIQVCLAGIFVALFVFNMIANEWTAEAEEQRQPQIAHIKNAAAKVKILIDCIDDKEAKKKAERVYDLLHSSPVKSHPDLEPLEVRIQESIRALEEAVSAGNSEGIFSLSGSLEAMVDERNVRLKTYN